MSVKDVTFFRGKCGGGNDNSVKGQQSQSLSVEDGRQIS